jgi:hypothetical protein
LPPGTHWGWNVNDDETRAYVMVDEKIDARALVDEILADA